VGVVAECHQGGEEFEDDGGIDKVDPFPYRVGDPVGARGLMRAKTRRGLV